MKRTRPDYIRSESPTKYLRDLGIFLETSIYKLNNEVHEKYILTIDNDQIIRKIGLVKIILVSLNALHSDPNRSKSNGRSYHLGAYFNRPDNIKKQVMKLAYVLFDIGFSKLAIDELISLTNFNSVVVKNDYLDSDIYVLQGRINNAHSFINEFKSIYLD